MATSLVVATPTEIVSWISSRTASLISSRDRRPVTEQLARTGDIEERLVDRDGLDERRVAPQDRHHVAADVQVLAPVDGEEDGVGTAPAGLAQRHRRVDAEAARLVAGGRHDAALVRPAPAHDHRLAAQLGAIALLDRREERVEVDVEDGPGLHRRHIIAPPSPGRPGQGSSWVTIETRPCVRFTTNSAFPGAETIPAGSSIGGSWTGRVPTRGAVAVDEDRVTGRVRQPGPARSRHRPGRPCVRSLRPTRAPRTSFAARHPRRRRRPAHCRCRPHGSSS